MELRQLLTFRTVAQTLSFSQAAAQLSYAQSTVSAQIQALETELAVSLFDRLGKQVALTESGKQLLAYADKILFLSDQAQAAVTNGDGLSGTLTLSAPGTLCTYRLPAVLRLLRQRLPGLQIIIPTESETNLYQSLRDGKIDVAFSMQEPFQAPNLVVEPLVAEPLLVVTYPEHPLARKETFAWADLQGQPMVLTEATCGYRKVFERVVKEAGLTIDKPMEFFSVDAIKQCVMAGLGLTFLPQVAVQQELGRGDLVALSGLDPQLQVTSHVMWHKDKWMSPLLCAFLAVVREAFGSET